MSKEGNQASRIPKGCDQQGRFPEAAEAATEVGQEEEPNFYSVQYFFEEFGFAIIWGFAVFAVIAFIATLAGYFSQ